ncbi:MAG: tetratricopeptide repeat protein, partial [Waterburya sp.]
FQQAQDYYQLALDIFIEYGDRYSQASSYFQLGRVAEELEELEQAKSYYLKDLELTAESNDEHGLNITLSNLARFYQKTQDNSLITEVAKMFDVTEAEVKELFEKFNAENQ